jgi:hypothetical protein
MVRTQKRPVQFTKAFQTAKDKGGNGSNSSNTRAGGQHGTGAGNGDGDGGSNKVALPQGARQCAK